MEPAERQGKKRFPLSHRERGRMRERDCKGNKSLLQLGRKLLGWRGEEGKGGGARVKRRQQTGRKGCDNPPESQERSGRGWGAGGGRVFWIVLMKKVNHEARNKR